jgi:Rieske Fe-S protein
MGHAEAYRDDGTPAEQSRRTFMVNAVVAMSGVIGLTIAIPVLGSLIPAADAASANWSPLSADEFATLQKATEKPAKLTFALRRKDGYFPEADSEQFVWAVRTTPEKFKAARPELFQGAEKLPYDAITLGFVLFSPICPHLGSRYAWNDDLQQFKCPAHGSQYTSLGAHTAGPAQRGLDPLPLREQAGKAEVTWIVYQGNTPHHIILAYT